MYCSKGSSDSSHVSHPHLANTTLQGGPVFACVCVRLAGLGWVGKCVWWPSSSLDVGSSSSPPPSDLIQFGVTPYCTPYPTASQKQFVIVKTVLIIFFSHVTAIVSANNMFVFSVLKSNTHRQVTVIRVPSSGFRFYVIQWHFIPALTNMTVISKRVKC